MGRRDLAAMGMAGERQRHALRHLGENVRLVREQNHRVAGADARQRAGQIIHAFEPLGPSQ